MLQQVKTKLAVALVFGAMVVGFGCGYFLGHHKHRYVRLGPGLLMYDETTGRVCNGMKKPSVNVPAGFNIVDEGLKASDPPFCGEE